jgi:hypothetical protein
VQLKEAESRLEFLRAEREKLIELLASEQTNVAGLKREIEAAREKVRCSTKFRKMHTSTSKSSCEHWRGDCRFTMPVVMMFS